MKSALNENFKKFFHQTFMEFQGLASEYMHGWGFMGL